MSDPDRRFENQGSEPPLTMDRRRGGSAHGPAPVTLIVSVLLLLLVGGAVLYMYRGGARSANDAPEPLGAPLGDVRAPPPAEQRNPDPAAGLTISKDDPNAATATPTLAPPPEQPLPATRAPAAAPAVDSKGFPSALPPPPPPADAKPVLAPTHATSTGKAVEKSDAIGALIADAGKLKTVTQAKPAKVAAEIAGPVSAAVVQIGAFSSERLADKEWSKAAAVAPGPMAGKGKRVVPVTKDGATLYRTSITGFASREQAQSLCDRLKVAGGNCFVR